MEYKTAAEKLLAIADAIEKEAFENSYFMCDNCNHTANLTTINSKRRYAASQEGIEKVTNVTINDKIACPACGGDMEYVPTEESERYYHEAADEDEIDLDLGAPEDDKDSKKDKKKDEESEEEDEEAETGTGEEEDTKEEEPEGDLFEPVDDQEEKKKKEEDEEEKAKNSEPDDGINLDFEDDQDKPDEEEEMKEEADKPKRKPKKRDKPDDGKATFPKEESPKFEKMPKEASDDEFLRSVARYAAY